VTTSATLGQAKMSWGLNRKKRTVDSSFLSVFSYALSLLKNRCFWHFSEGAISQASRFEKRFVSLKVLKIEETVPDPMNGNQTGLCRSGSNMGWGMWNQNSM